MTVKVLQRGLWPLALAVLAFCQPGAVGATEPVDAQQIASPINVYEASVAYPGPSWVSSADYLDQVEVNREKHGPNFLLQYIPKGEKFEDWSKMLTVSAHYVPKADKLNLSQMAVGGFQALMRACGRDNFKIQRIAKGENTVTFAMYCASTPYGPVRTAYGPDTGEVILKNLHRYKDTYIEVYESWRGPKFDLEDETTWPVSRATLDETIRKFAHIEINETTVPFTERYHQERNNQGTIPDHEPS